MKKNIPILQDVYKDYFKIGAAVNDKLIVSSKELIKKHFNSITAENEMKPISINPSKDKYTYEKADKLIDFAKENNKAVRGHTLVWHNQTSEDIFHDENGAKVSAEILTERLRQYISIVFNRYNDSVYCWDVVNEAVEDKGEQQLRKSNWLEILGENFLDIPFNLARELDPNVKLFYNDYNAVVPEKRDKIYELLKGMQDRGVALDGLGIQGHWNLYDFEIDDIKAAIEKYAELDIDIHITELDISLFSFEDKSNDLKEPTDELLAKQADYYQDIFAIFREYKDIISNVTLWGVADDYTWLDYFPVKDRKNWPLLFDENHQPKDAFWKIIDF
ncbi:endo-1,4-beta-xylanase [Natronospora cellulosivora (SeqCode)]